MCKFSLHVNLDLHCTPHLGPTSAASRNFTPSPHCSQTMDVSVENPLFESHCVRVLMIQAETKEQQLNGPRSTIQAISNQSLRSTSCTALSKVHRATARVQWRSEFARACIRDYLLEESSILYTGEICAYIAWHSESKL